MFLIDNLLMAPANGLMFVLREVAKAANEAQAVDERTLMAELVSLHRLLDNGELTEQAFDVQEATLLEKLDRLHGSISGDAASSHGA